jgi:N-acetylglucosamine-6-phosphate deacetylase
MDQLFRAVARGAGLAAAVRTTAATPARTLGLDGVGAIRTGFTANIVVLDDDWQVSGVMVDGQWRLDPRGVA